MALVIGAALLMLGVVQVGGPPGQATVPRPAAVSAIATRSVPPPKVTKEARRQQVREAIEDGRWGDARRDLRVLLQEEGYVLENRVLQLVLLTRQGDVDDLVSAVKQWFLAFGVDPWPEEGREVLMSASGVLEADPQRWLEAFGVKKPGEPPRLQEVRLSMLARTQQWTAMATLLAAEGDLLTPSQRDYWEGWVNWEIGSRDRAVNRWVAVVERAARSGELAEVTRLTRNLPEEAWTQVQGDLSGPALEVVQSIPGK